MEAARIPVSKVRSGLPDVIGRARYGQEDTIVLDSGDEAAVVISMDKYREFQRLREEEDRRVVLARLAEFDQARAAGALPQGTVEFYGPADVATYFGVTR
jgi:prevent-host-death family protein